MLALAERAETADLESMLEQAARLFSEYGYHGVSTRQIALVTGLNAATVHRHAETKRDLYRMVLESLYREDRALVEAWSARTPAGSVEDLAQIRELLERLIDRVIARVVESPMLARLHMRRWFDPQDEISAIENDLYPKIYKPMIDFLERKREKGIVHFEGDFRLFLRGVDWLVVGYFVAGPMGPKVFRTNPLDPDSLQQFRAFLVQYVFRMLGIG